MFLVCVDNFLVKPLFGGYTRNILSGFTGYSPIIWTPPNVIPYNHDRILLSEKHKGNHSVSKKNINMYS